MYGNHHTINCARERVRPPLTRIIRRNLVGHVHDKPGKYAWRMIKYKRGKYRRQEAVFVRVNSSGIEQKTMDGVFQKDAFNLTCLKARARKRDVTRGIK